MNTVQSIYKENKILTLINPNRIPHPYLNFGHRHCRLQHIWISSLEQSADGPHTARLVIQPFQTVAENQSAA